MAGPQRQFEFLSNADFRASSFNAAMSCLGTSFCTSQARGANHHPHPPGLLRRKLLEVQCSPALDLLETSRALTYAQGLFSTWYCATMDSCSGATRLRGDGCGTAGGLARQKMNIQ